MHTKLICPSANVLAELIQGQLVEPQLSELTGHLEECPACQARVSKVPPSNALIESLRGNAPVEDQIARAAPRPLIEKIKLIPRRHSSSAHGALADTPAALHDTLFASKQQRFDFLSPPQQADELGRLGRYRILKVLGQGGMGVVFLADDPQLQRFVALKAMLPNVAAAPLAKERFLREARATARLKSDHIVTIYEVAEEGGVPYLAMELLEGESLADVLKTGQPLEARQIISIARDVARGLAAAHEAGLIHRDIKPGNLWLEHSDRKSESKSSLLTPDPYPLTSASRVKILDFGLARPGTDDDQITQSGTSVGTPAYMSPEQARGDKGVDARADLFSLGCVLYSLCVGEIPFQAATTMGTLLAITLHEPVAPAARNKSIPPALSALVMQLLAKDPAQRPNSAREVIERLQEIERSPAASPPRKRRPQGPLIAGLTTLALAIVAAVAAAIYFWQLPDGRVVSIECSDPAIKIAFDDGALKVAGAYQEPLIVEPGKVGLRIARGDDFKFETDKLIVNKGDKIALKIEVVEGKVQIVQAGKGVLDSKELPTPDERVSWEQSIARLDVHQQAAAVAAQLKKLNPSFDATSVAHKIENGVVSQFEFHDGRGLKDLAPLRALTGLKELYLDGNGGGADIGPLRGLRLTAFISNGCPLGDIAPLTGMPLTRVGLWGCLTTDLSPLRGMKLVEANCGNSAVRDISVLKGMPLEFVCLNISEVNDLSPLAGAPLKTLYAANTKVKDLRPVAKAPIEWLCIDGSPIEDLSPLLMMPLVKLEIDNPKQHAVLLRRITTLKTINHKSVAEVLGEIGEATEAGRSE